MTDDLDPLSPEILKALDVERSRPPATVEQLSRLAARVESSFTPAVPPTDAPSSAPSSAPAAAATKGLSAALGGKALLVAVGLGIGGVVGAQVQARLGTPREVIVERRVEVRVEVPVERPVEVPVAVPDRAAPEPAPPLPAERPQPKKTTRAPIEVERLLIEQATAAFSRGNAAQTLDACAQHARQFPSGQLSEERESLAIRALLRLDRRDEARERAAAFRKSYPDGLLLDVVEKALEEAK